MKANIVFALFLFSVTISISAQSNEIKIPFLATAPNIDGLPEENLTSIAWQNFDSTEKTNEQNPDYTIRYKIAYGISWLYLIIEAESDTIIFRDRAYQNGDGFHLVIAKPDSGRPTDEFYVLRFSPANPAKNIAARKGVWYYNIDLSGKSLSSAAKFVCQSNAGKSFFELLLPWNEVYPWHPLLSGGIGLNLCFVKAVGSKEKNYYFLKYDKCIQWEQHKRDYLHAVFEHISVGNNATVAMLEQSTVQAGCAIKVKTNSYAQSEGTNTYYFAIRSADNYIYKDLYRELAVTKGLNALNFDLPTNGLQPGGYKVTWKTADNSEGEMPLTILPEINFGKEKLRLEELRKTAVPGSCNTLSFMLQNLEAKYRQLKPYETAGLIRENYSSYLNYVNELTKGNDLLVNKNGIFRRAFLSKVDSTLQPYTIKIPNDLDKNKKYPLFVMLHGSGSDDRDMLSGIPLTENNFIEIAPNGRGTSNCFTTDNAQTDVKEAIDDAIRNYAVDTTRIVIAGFSMGGYGAYRIFYEYPKLFRGVVVFSGHPSLASLWIGEDYPDFLQNEYVKPFNKVPVFVYHSKNDLNCPYDLTKQLVGKLQSAGAIVTFITTEDSGHGIIDKENIPVYYKWLKNLVEI